MMKTFASPSIASIRLHTALETPCTLTSAKGMSLTEYMRQPCDRYSGLMPRNAQFQRKDQTTFNLTVPQVRMFGVSVTPTLVCEVTQKDDSVIIESCELELGGSPYIESLNDCFSIAVKCVITWVDLPTDKRIVIGTDMFGECNPPFAFKLLGMSVLESTATMVVKKVMHYLISDFGKELSRDYARWLTEWSQSSCSVTGDEEKQSSGGEVRRRIVGSVQGEIDGSNTVSVETKKLPPKPEFIMRATSFSLFVNSSYNGSVEGEEDSDDQQHILLEELVNSDQKPPSTSPLVSTSSLRTDPHAFSKKSSSSSTDSIQSLKPENSTAVDDDHAFFWHDGDSAPWHRTGAADSTTTPTGTSSSTGSNGSSSPTNSYVSVEEYFYLNQIQSSDGSVSAASAKKGRKERSKKRKEQKSGGFQMMFRVGVALLYIFWWYALQFLLSCIIGPFALGKYWL